MCQFLFDAWARIRAFPFGEPLVVHNCVREMKTKRLTTILCVLALLVSTSTPALANEGGDAASVAVDVVVARPVTLALTIVGSVLFVVSLPVAIPSGSVNKAANTLVVAPAKDTFTRPLGDLDDFLEY